MITPGDEFEAHFYAFLRKLPKKKLYESLPLKERKIDRLIDYAHSDKEGRRPVNKREIGNLRHALLDALDDDEDVDIELAQDYG